MPYLDCLSMLDIVRITTLWVWLLTDRVLVNTHRGQLDVEFMILEVVASCFQLQSKMLITCCFITETEIQHLFMILQGWKVEFWWKM